jgi:hypothetical protein
MYAWMVRQRQAYRKGELSKSQIKLSQETFRLEEDTAIKDRIERLIDYFKNGNKSPADEVIKYDLTRIKEMHRLKTLPDSDLRLLREGNVPIDSTVNDYNWLQRIKELLIYYRDHRNPPKHHTPLYLFCIKERRYLNQKHPNSEFIERNREAKELYDEVKAIITKMEKPEWDHMFERLRDIGAVHGRISYESCDENLLQWMWRQRRFIRDGKLPPEKIAKLLTIREVDWQGSKKGSERYRLVKK